jgi:hypothetical protein
LIIYKKLSLHSEKTIVFLISKTLFNKYTSNVTIGKSFSNHGPVVDVVFNSKDAELPKNFDSLEIIKKDGTN